MTDCSNGDIRDLLPDLLHGRLDASERARVEHHVSSCDACRAELALLSELRSTMRRVPAIDTAKISASIPAYRPPVRQTRWSGLRAAAAIAAIAIGGTSIALVGRELQPASRPGDVAVAPEPVRRANAPESRSIGREATVPAPIPAPAPRLPSREAVPATSAAEPVSLAMTGGAIGELSDRELSTLLDEIDTLDALPSEDVESAGALGRSLSLEQSR